MNVDSNSLVVKIAENLFKEAYGNSDSWQVAFARFQIMQGAIRNKYFYFDARGRTGFISPNYKQDILHKAQLLQDALIDNKRPWIVCLVKVTREGEVSVDFEYENENRWGGKPTGLKDELLQSSSGSIHA